MLVAIIVITGILMPFFASGVMWRDPNFRDFARSIGRLWLALYLIVGGCILTLTIIGDRPGLRNSLIRIVGFLLLLFVPFVLGLVVGWIARKISVKSESDFNTVMTQERRDCTVYRFELTITTKDFVDWEDADIHPFIVRKSFRRTLTSLAILWIGVGIFLLALTPPNEIGVILIGLGGFWFHSVAIPRFIKMRIARRRNLSDMNVIVEFSDDGIQLDYLFVGKIRWGWNELSYVNDTSKGILFHFQNQTSEWLPNRVFRDETERIAFVSFAKSHVVPRSER